MIDERNQGQTIINKDITTSSNTIEDLDETGFTLFKARRYGDSLQYYEKALEKNPNSLLSLNGKAINLLYLGRYAEALECYEKALSENPNSFISWYGKAICLVKIGDNDEALRCHDRAMEIFYIQAAKGKNKAQLMDKLHFLKL